MKRFIAATINWSFCLLITIMIRCLIAIPNRFVLLLSKPTTIHSILENIPWYIVVIMPFFVSCIYYLFIKKFFNAISLGEKIVGIRVLSEFVIWHAILEGVAITFYPITIVFLCFTGRMPYDKIMGIKVLYVNNTSPKHVKKFYSVTFLLVGSIVLVQYFSKLDFEQKIGTLYYGLGLTALYINSNYIAGAYTNCLELDYGYLDEKEITEDEKGERETTIFSEKGKNTAWAFVITDSVDYIWDYQNLDMNLDYFSYANNTLVITFGRKLGKVRVLYPGMNSFNEESDLNGYPSVDLHLELEKEYNENMVYFYSVPNDIIYKLVDKKNYDILTWMHTNYKVYQVYYPWRFVSIEQGEGAFFKRWAWAYRWIME